MAKLNLTLPYGELAITGKQITFVAPCESAGLTHIIIQNDEFELVDSSGNNIIAGAFTSGAMVSVILNVENKKAYIQNADINSQLKESFVGKSEKIVNSDSAITKVVPLESTPIAEVSKIGGITRKCTNLFNDIEWFTNNNFIKQEDGSYKAHSLNITCWVNTTKKSGSMYITLIGKTALESSPIYLQVKYTDGSNFAACILKASDTGNFITLTAQTDANKTVDCINWTYGSVTGEYYVKGVSFSFDNVGYEPYFEGLRSAPVTEIESIGANLIPYPYRDSAGIINDVSFYMKDNGRIVFNGTASKAFSFSLSSSLFLQKGTYTYSYTGELSSGVTLRVYGNTTTFAVLSITAKQATFTLDTDTEVQVYLLISSTSAVSGDVSVMLNDDIIALPYAPYIEPVVFPIPEAVQNIDGYGDGLGETCYNYVNFEHKQFVKRVGKVDMGTLDWAYGSGVFYAFVGDKKVDLSNILCSAYPNANVVYTEAQDKTITGHPILTYIYVKDNSYTDATTFKSAMSGEMLHYELETPEVIDISDILSTDSLISVGGGGIVTAHNEFSFEVPYEVAFYKKSLNGLCACTVVGELLGTASRAVCDEHGNNIPQTYASKSLAMFNDEAKAVKTIPENSALYARVAKIGGMTRKCANLLDVPETFEFVQSTGVDVYLPAGQYVVSWGQGGAFGSVGYGSIRFYNNDVWSHITSIEGFRVVTLTQDETKVYFYSNGTSSADSNGVTATMKKLMLNEGATALPYEPYFEGFTSSIVTDVESVGSNLFNDTEWFASHGFSKQSDNSWVCIVQNEICWTNTTRRSGSISINVIGKTEDYGGTVMYLEAYYTDGSYPTVFRLMNPSSDYVAYSIKTDPSKTVDYVLWTYGVSAPYYLKGVSISFAETSEYTPYTKTTLSIPAEIQSLEGYGVGLNETAYNYVDFENKQFVKCIGKVDMGSLTYTHRESNGRHIFTTTLADLPLCKNTSVPINALCDKFTAVPTNVTWTNGDMGYQYGNSRVLDFVANDFTDVALFKSAMSGVMLYYELETPEVIDISHLLTADLISVQSLGTISMVNERNYDLPNTVVFYKKENKVLESETFVGDLKGRATYSDKSNFAEEAETANSAKRDGNGKDIATTYALTPIISSTDIEAGVTPLADGQSYHVYE